ncbi:hypothetical protein IMCC3317_13280 [Kordia antarctica]|uniref:Uncharacterized protein n=1 Tax=Kordia antarctica TaxID=1218801 RepID=A0A7L4ZHM8_9FLAO|nr:hypothetical protein IMCC3317_13280 [Kordia antarctica]
MNFSKFSPRIQKFLTKNPCYTAEKTKKNTLKFYIELTLFKIIKNVSKYTYFIWYNTLPVKIIMVYQAFNIKSIFLTLKNGLY